MTASRIAAVFLTLMKASTTGTLSWDEVMEGVRAQGIKVTNWMVVRSDLQRLINAGALTRTSDLHREDYRIDLARLPV
jgi:hypothetical protein